MCLSGGWIIVMGFGHRSRSTLMRPAVKPVTWHIRGEHTEHDLMGQTHTHTHLMLVMLPVSEPSLHLSSWLATICRSASSSLVRRSNCNSWRERERESVSKQPIYCHIWGHSALFSVLAPPSAPHFSQWAGLGSQSWERLHCVWQFPTARFSLRSVWYVAKLWRQTMPNVTFEILLLKCWSNWIL